MQNQSTSSFEAEIAKRDSIITEQRKRIVYLESLINAVPVSLYWKDKDGFWLGLSDTGSEDLRQRGFALWKKEDIIGKTDYDLFDKRTADIFRKNDLEVMERSSEVMHFEEVCGLPSGGQVVQLSNKRAVLDREGKLVGVIGNSVDITYLKKIEQDLLLAQAAAAEAEQLRVENAVSTNLAKLAGQVVHDIRSPLTSLILLVGSCDELPEAKRVALQEGMSSLQDIANHLLNEYKVRESDDSSEAEAPCTLVSTMLLEVLSQKRYEYQGRDCVLKHSIRPDAYFAFVGASSSDLKRMISNLVNNAYEASAQDGITPQIEVGLAVSARDIKITVRDNGKGMPQHIIDKVMQDIAVTADKKSGHGIGLTQVRDVLKRYGATMQIDSTMGHGTTFTLVFPRMVAPKWIADRIVLNDHDTVVIVDDEKSIHGAWATRFESIIATASGVKLKHFTVGADAVDYLNGLSAEEKKQIVLLTDYELLKQPVSGLDFIQQTDLVSSILVTSHYAEKLVQERAVALGIKILPKQLAPEIEISVAVAAQRSVDVVMIDDDPGFSRSLKMTIFAGYDVDSYEAPKDFLKVADQYSKEVKILTDYNFIGPISGVELAEKLHAQGFKNLYLLSGQYFRKGELPAYLNVIPKDDIDQLKCFM